MKLISLNINSFDSYVQTMVQDSQKLSHWFRVVYNIKEKLEVKRRKRIRHLHKHIVALNFPKTELTVAKLRELYAENAWGSARIDTRSSIVTCYLLAQKLIDRYMRRIRRYLEGQRFPDDEYLRQARDVIDFHDNLSRRVRQMVDCLREQDKYLNEFLIDKNMSLKYYKAFRDSYDHELKLQQHILEESKVKVNAYLRYRRTLSKNVFAYTGFQKQNQAKVALFGLSFTAVCILLPLVVGVPGGLVFSMMKGLTFAGTVRDIADNIIAWKTA